MSPLDNLQKKQYGKRKDGTLGIVPVQGLPEHTNKPMMLMLHENGLMFRTLGFFGAKSYGIKFTNLKHIEYYNWEEAIQKDKSVIGRAVVAGLVFGPIGAIIGGLSGLGKRTINPDYALVFVKENDDTIIFNVKGNDVQKIKGLLKKHCVRHMMQI